MDVWVKMWEYPTDGETNVTIWISELDALRSVCGEIRDFITNDWDMDDEDLAAEADKIDELINTQKYREAMDYWNDYQSNLDYGQFWSVMKKEVLHGDEEVVTSAPPIAYKPVHSGATCRGPCGQYNEYAYADRQDGTHLCRQCSTFQHIFGVNKS